MLKQFWGIFFRGALWKWFTGSVGAVIGLFLIGKNIFNFSVLNSILLGIGVLIAAFWLHFAYFTFTNRRKGSPYGEAIVLLKDGFAGINKLKREEFEDSAEIMRILMEMCDTLKLVFDKITKVDCSVSIKIPTINVPISGDAVVENLCRDYKHYLVRDTEEYKKQVHRVSGNTAYLTIIGNVLSGNTEKFFYLNNDVPKTKDYHTTSRPAYPDGNLPYKSELVYPILPLMPENNKTPNWQPKYEIWGFLCVDCCHPDKFNNHYDVAIIQGVADGVFDVIMKINKSRH